MNDEPADRFDQCDAHKNGAGERCSMEMGHESPHSFEELDEELLVDQAAHLSTEGAAGVSRVPPREIHDYFELTYAHWLTMPRTLLQSMPDEWQQQFVALLDKFNEEMGWAMDLLPATNVQVLKRSPEMIEDREDCETCGGEGTDPQNPDEPCLECDGECSFEGEERYETPEEVGTIPIPIAPYQRGRTRVPLASMSMEEVEEGYFEMKRQWLKANNIDEFRKVYGPEYQDGEEVEVVRNVPPHVLPPVLEETPHGRWDAEIVTVCEASDNALYMVDVALGPFEESDHIIVQLHADQIRKHNGD